MGAGKIPPPYLWLRLVPLVRLLVCYGIEMWHVCRNENPSVKDESLGLESLGRVRLPWQNRKIFFIIPKR